MSGEEEKQPQNPLAVTHELLAKMKSLSAESEFCFGCHPGLSCWGECCRNPNLFLTPYDILRLKNSLNLESGEFLEKYTEVYVGEDFGLPVVRIRLDEKGACPFLGESGCKVYQDRPTSCRTYPIGQGVSSGTGKGDSQKVFFKVEEEYCLGWSQTAKWTVEKWLEDQGVFKYNQNNEYAVHLAFHPNLGEPGKMDQDTVAMIFMALSDLDRFRKFVLTSSFLQKFELEEGLVEKIKEDDEALMALGQRWVSFFALGGMNAMTPKKPGKDKK